MYVYMYLYDLSINFTQFRDITSVLFVSGLLSFEHPSLLLFFALQVDQCRYFITVLTIFIRKITEIHDN